jgi:hypothetical protein
VTKPTRPTVSEPALQQALSAVGPHIENYHENLDAVSNDIRNIERYLADSGIRVSARIRIGGSGTRTVGPIDVLQNYSGEIYEDDEYLEWGPISEQENKWRVLWRKTRCHGELELCEGIAIAGPTFNGASEVLDSRPLIETTVATRLAAHKHLAALVREVGKQVEIRPIGEQEEISF